MFYIVLAVLLALIFLGGVVASLLTRTAGGFVAAGIALVLLVVATLGFSATTVSARAVAINTSFGRYDGTLSNGFHMTKPWSSTEEFTTLLQRADFTGDNKVPVNFVGGGRGDTNLVVQWQISDSTEGAKNLWQRYKTFDNVEQNLVDNSAKNVTREVMGSYEPIGAIAGENLAKINQDVQTKLQASVAQYGVVIQSVSVTNVALDGRTQAALDKIVEANANISRAKSEQTRAKIDAETAKLREKQGALSAAANQRYCLDVVNAWDVSKNGPLPAGFSCTGAGAPFVVTK